ncbi:MAG: hypothetical protein LUC37_01895 [Prevotella sp.]|nr:hypothetical protein [Prevotella sp.]
MKEQELLERIAGVTPEQIYHKRMNRCLLMIEEVYQDAEFLLSDANVLAENGDITLDTLAEVSSLEFGLQRALCTMKKQVEESLEIRRTTNTW